MKNLAKYLSIALLGLNLFAFAAKADDPAEKKAIEYMDKASAIFKSPQSIEQLDQAISYLNQAKKIYPTGSGILYILMAEAELEKACLFYSSAGDGTKCEKISKFMDKMGDLIN